MGRRGSCFHMATVLSTSVASAQAWMTCTSRAGVKSDRNQPKTKALPTVPASSITYISPTTLGCAARGERSVARARPAV